MEISMRMNFDVGKSVCLFGKQKCSVSHRQYATQQFVVSCNKVKEVFVKKEGKANTFYQLLSLSSSENVGLEEIRKAYRSKALQFHPDVCPSNIKEDECTRRFVELRKAYEVLSNPEARRMYDYELSLADSFGGRRRGHGKFGGDGGREGIPKEIWERQLSGLQKRCGDRIDRRKYRL